VAQSRLGGFRERVFSASAPEKSGVSLRSGAVALCIDDPPTTGCR
jgi:hypothetical protein